jgi:hypothetical protein
MIKYIVQQPPLVGSTYRVQNVDVDKNLRKMVTEYYKKKNFAMVK